MNEHLNPYPDALTPTHWEKKKGSLPPGSELPEKLKALLGKHKAIDWACFVAGWSRPFKAADELKAAYELRDRDYKKVVALRPEAEKVSKAASALAKDKAAAASRPTLEAARSIEAAAERFVKGVELGFEALKKEFEDAQAGLAENAKADAKEDAKKGAQGGADADEDEAGSALLDPQRLLAQLNLCKRDPARRVNFGFVDGHDQQPAVLALHPRTGAKKLYAALQTETGVKAGAYGTAWVEDTVLTLQLDKPLAGLVKRVRPPLRACGFRVTKVVIWNADGSVFEQEDDGAGGGAAAGAEAPPAAPAPAAEYEACLARVQPLVDQAIGAKHPAATKLPALMSFSAAKAAAGAYTAALQGLNAVEKMLAAAPSASGASGAAGAKVAFAQARLAWDATRRQVQAELQKLQRTLLAECKDEPDIAEITQNSGLVFSVLDELDRHDTGLIDVLDEALNAQTTEARQGLQRQAAARIAAYRDYVQTDTLVRDVQDNGFEDVSIVGPVTERLTLMAAQLRSLASL